MTHTSPESYLVWGLVTSVLFTFLVYHMWSFDRFQCLRWNNSPNSGAFKRVMTYCYLLSVPLIATYAIGFTVIKYRQGLMEFEGAIVPKPYIFWPENERRAIFPLMLTFTVAWSLEMITHLEELCFWLFLVNSSPDNWFQSRYFRTWIVGSCVAIVYMPMLTIWSRSDPLKCEAWTFLGGSLGSLTLTLSFSPVLWRFPAFLTSLKAEGVDTATIIRLTKFHELNTIRIVFRYLFVVPLVILGADGVRAHKHINESMLWTDFLTMIAAFGCCISSALTLVIFFPRSIESEIAAKDAARERRRSRSIASIAPDSAARFSDYSHISNGRDVAPPSAKPYNFLASEDGHGVASPDPAHTEWTYGASQELQMQQLPALRPNRSVKPGTVRGLANENMYSSGVHPMVHNFTSPIELYDGGKAPTMLAFTQH
ncbi:hypothetical protein C8F04DRAFT_1123980 [Mycena alexandri]|uniref:Transmembrane protein n=1 Tax=Mycena alexandri TaxID=1745969 RepID=A0AAD6WZN5_9AGAR|nr:hypothetical protein C8F04DRAFT_1123980 [Mycena alexandri]